MVIDSSALLAIVFGESDQEIYINAIAEAMRDRSNLYIPASVLVEAGIAAEQRQRGVQLDTLTDWIGADVVRLDERLAQIARAAFLQFGRGRHKANLNFGDCMSYATARSLELPLLYKGADFENTDIQSALRSR